MDTGSTMTVHDTRPRIAADAADLSGWRVNNANLSGLHITKANLAGASIAESQTEGMTIDGIALADLMAAWRAANTKD